MRGQGKAQAHAVPVLMYHHISTSPGMITVSPDRFAAQMAYLAQAGYQTVGAAQLSAYLAGGSLPARSIVLTFDDGYLDNWVHAHPVLQRYGFTALCFLVTSWPGDGAPRVHAHSGGELPELLSHHEGDLAIENGEADRTILRWSEIDAMRRAGTFEFHSHTHSHVRWDKVARNREEKCAALRRDLLTARAALETRIGEASDHLCWPQGFYDDDYRQVAREAGFRHFYTCEMGPNVRGAEEADERSIYRLEVRDRPASWLASRLWVHSRPTLSRAYLAVKR
ncbi:Polysaccharide deacetylase [Burkholderia sp. D7]|nr:Polysaccharide deacetylase [Burkholderia sp. D7]